jgi:tRNA(His) 5'-end guanylyltransferase
MHTLRKHNNMHTPTGRRASKLVSTFVSCFTGNYVRHWPAFLPGQELLTCPVFDGRAVAYPNLAVLRDYLCWRQADTHVNNQVCARVCGDGHRCWLTAL